ncbi:MAG: DUF1254 domain-containing protein [Actinomycetota bacterium]|nr:DUF1254 domain-containing protein [Actinomycetota bacterium]
MIRRVAVLVFAAAMVAACSTTGSDEATTTSAPPPPGAAPVSPQDARAIAKEAYIYGFPLVDSYRIRYSYFVDRQDPEYMGGFNEVHSAARLLTPEDKTVQTPNADTPYSMLGLDLRTEPLVLTVPPVEQDRYYSLQFIDGYTYNVAYVGSRTTGNGGGKYLVAGPGWDGEKPEGIDEVIRFDTEVGLVIYRTQLFGPSDLGNVEKIQAGYAATPLSAYLNQPAPAPAPPIDFAPPLTGDQERTSPQFFEILGFTLRSMPALPQETELRKRFASIGIGPDGDFEADKLAPEMRSAVEAGMADAWAELDKLSKDKIQTGEVATSQLFGSAEDLGGNYLYRMAGAVYGIFGNTAAEALYPVLSVDSTGAALTGANNYVVKLPAGQLAPVNAFWSLTMYEMPQSLLVENPIQRYLINSPMLPSLVPDPDGGYTIYVQNESPGPDKESNWLPAPKGPFQLILRLYWPKPDALNGTWKPPQVVRT